MELKVGFATDVGRKRPQNQDNVAAVHDLGLFVVADGMGGHRGGETASAMVVEIVPKLVQESCQNPDFDPRTTLVNAIREANTRIYERASTNAGLHGMGTTTTALLFKDNKLTIGHVGDSRCYYLQPHQIWQATRDHSLVQERLRAGLINREEAKTDRMKNVITRSVGFEPVVDVEIYEMTVKAGDVFVVCSDGLSGMIEDPKLLEIVQKNIFDSQNSPQKAVENLIEAANSNGGDDNITTIMIVVN